MVRALKDKVPKGNYIIRASVLDRLVDNKMYYKFIEYGNKEREEEDAKRERDEEERKQEQLKREKDHENVFHSSSENTLLHQQNLQEDEAKLLPKNDTNVFDTEQQPLVKKVLIDSPITLSKSPVKSFNQ
jgi:actin-related protein